jgi:hypothetical protein
MNINEIEKKRILSASHDEKEINSFALLSRSIKHFQIIRRIILNHKQKLFLMTISTLKGRKMLIN